MGIIVFYMPRRGGEHMGIRGCGSAKARPGLGARAEELERRVLLSAAIAALGNQQTFLSGQDPRAVALVDVNRDGKLDAVVANTTGNTISVLMNDGTGQYPGSQTFAAGSAPFAVTVGDVNGDGERAGGEWGRHVCCGKHDYGGIRDDRGGAGGCEWRWEVGCVGGELREDRHGERAAWERGRDVPFGWKRERGAGLDLGDCGGFQW